MNTRPRLVVGNWKLHGSLSTNTALLEQIRAADKAAVTLVICAPFPYLAQCQSLLAGSAITWGAQDISTEARDASTDEVAVSMLSELGCGYVIVGHSERRSYHGETDAQVTARALHALERGITPIVCVGEAFTQREASETERVVGQQLDMVPEALSVEQLGRIVVVYKSVWAIGIGKAASNERTQAVYAFLRTRVAARNAGVAQRSVILYDGSVKPGNAGELFAIADADGGLIGGASLKAGDFLAIGRA